MKVNSSQLKLLNLYLKCAYAQLALHKEDYFIDKNKNLKVSQALVQACNSVIYEVKELENAIKITEVGCTEVVSF